MIVKRFLCFLAVVFVLVAGCSVPVLAEGESSGASAEIRAIPVFPEDGALLANHVIIYSSASDEFVLFCSNFLPTPYVSSSDSSVLCALFWSYERRENVYYDVLVYTLDAVNGSDWVSVQSPSSVEVQCHNYPDSHGGDTYYRVFFGLSSWSFGSPDLTHGYVVYSDFTIAAGDYSFFPTPSPIARTRPYLPLHTDLWQTIAAGVEKVVIASIAIVGTLVLILLLRRLGKKIATF